MELSRGDGGSDVRGVSGGVVISWWPLSPCSDPLGLVLSEVDVVV